MSLYGQLFRRGLYPFYESVLCRRRTLAHLAELERTQWLSPAETRQRQVAALRAMLVHCGAHVPYYRRLFAEVGFDPAAVESLEQLAALPVLTRELIRQHHDELIDERIDPTTLVQYGTGGSTGSPLQFRISHEYYERRNAGQYRAYRWAGWDLGEKTLWIWGVRGAVTPRPDPPWKKLKKAAFQAAFRNVVRTVYQFSDERLAEYLAFWNRWRPVCVVGYAFALYCLARYIQASGTRVAPVRGIILAAEGTTPEQRQTIAEAFGSPVHNTYGSMEVNLIAAECGAHVGLHENTDNLVVELTRDGVPVAPGEEGEVTLTTLVHPAMPFVRYQIGDLARAVPEPCPCGRGAPLLADVTGRTMDIVRTPEGHLVSGVWFNHTMLAVREVKRFQVVQRQVERLTMRLVPADGWGPEAAGRVETALRRALGERIAIDFEPVDEVELSASGKYRVITSTVGLSHEPAEPAR